MLASIVDCRRTVCVEIHVVTLIKFLLSPIQRGTTGRCLHVSYEVHVQPFRLKVRVQLRHEICGPPLYATSSRAVQDKNDQNSHFKGSSINDVTLEWREGARTSVTICDVEGGRRFSVVMLLITNKPSYTGDCLACAVDQSSEYWATEPCNYTVCHQYLASLMMHRSNAQTWACLCETCQTSDSGCTSATRDNGDHCSHGEWRECGMASWQDDDYLDVEGMTVPQNHGLSRLAR